MKLEATFRGQILVQVCKAALILKREGQGLTGVNNGEASESLSIPGLRGGAQVIHGVTPGF